MIQVNILKLLNFSKGKGALDISIALKEGGCYGLFGESGSGKSTLLKIIAGLTIPDNGKISVGNKVWLDSVSKINLPPYQRNIGFVFQENSLFPNMSVFQNLSYALKNSGSPYSVHEMLQMVELEEFQNVSPCHLSGGQVQRLAIARALIRNPPIILLDEPFSSLSQHLKAEMKRWLKKIHDKFQPTLLIVSHDPEELTELCNIVYKIEHGKIVEEGSPEVLFNNKKTVRCLITDIRKFMPLTLEIILDSQGEKIELKVPANLFSHLKKGEFLDILI